MSARVKTICLAILIWIIAAASLEALALVQNIGLVIGA